MDEYSIHKNDPLIKLLRFCNIKEPVWLSVVFLVLFMLFTAWVCYFDLKPDQQMPFYITYSQNISWFYSLIFIFPFVLGLTFKYYLDLPEITLGLYEKLGMRFERAKFDEYWKEAFSIIDHRGIWILVVVVTGILNLVYFYFTYFDSPQNSWMACEIKCGDKKGFNVTAAGWVAVIIQTLLAYWIATFAVKGLLYIYKLHQFFQLHRSKIVVNPLHKDGLSGLGEIARLATWQSTILLLLGVYASLKVVDKIYMQQMTVSDDFGNIVVLTAYVLLAPLMFFSLLGAAHGVMSDAKQTFLMKFNNYIVGYLPESDSIRDPKEKKEVLELIIKEQDSHDLFDKKIRVWPFNLRSIQGFFGAVIVPLFPVLVPLMQWFLGL